MMPYSHIRGWWGCYSFILACLAAVGGYAQAPLKIFYQGGEPNDCWAFSAAQGAVTIDATNPKSGANSLRVGGNGIPPTVTFDPVDLNAFSGLFNQFQTSISVRSNALGTLVPNPNGDGMDIDENFVVELDINGSGFVQAGRIGTAADYTFNWSVSPAGYGNGCCAQGSGTSSYNGPLCGECLNTPVNTADPSLMPNPLEKTDWTGSETFTYRTTIRNRAVNGNVITAFNRADEFYFLDDVQLTAVPTVTFGLESLVQPTSSCGSGFPTFTTNTLVNGTAQALPPPFYVQWRVNGVSVAGAVGTSFTPDAATPTPFTVQAILVLCSETVNAVAYTTGQLPVTNIVTVDALVPTPVVTVPPAITFCGLSTPVTGFGVQNLAANGTTSLTVTNGATVSGTFPNFTVSAALPGIYTLTFLASNPTPSGTPCVDSKVVQVELKENPTAENGFPSAQAPTVCGLSVGLSAVAPGAGATGTWSVTQAPGGQTATFANPNAPNTTLTVSAPGVYEVVWTVNLNGCIATDSVSIPFAQPTTIAEIADSTLRQCTGFSIPVVASTILPPATGQWTVVAAPTGVPAPVFIPSTTAASVTFQAAAGGAYILRWTVNDGGCTTSDEITVLLQSPIDFAARHALGADFTTCQPTGTLAAPALSPDETGLWTASPASGVVVSQPTNPTSAVAYSIPGVYTLRWTVSDALFGCTATDSQRVVYQPITQAAAGTDRVSCGLNFTLTGNPPAQGEVASWSTPGNNPNILTPLPASGTSVDLQVAAEGQYTLVYTLRSSADPTCLSTDEVVVRVAPQLPAQVVALAPIQYCSGGQATLQLENTDSRGTVRILNPRDNSLLLTANAQTGQSVFSFSPVGSGSYAVEYGVVTNGVFCPVQDLMVPVEEFARPVPVVVTNIPAGGNLFYRQEQLSLNAESSTGATGYTWRILPMGLELQGASHAGIVFPDTGRYSVSLFLSGRLQGCDADTTFEVNVQNLELLLFPNVFSPNNDGINEQLVVYASAFSDVEVRVFNRWGTQVFYNQNLTRFWDGRDESGNRLPEGVYLLTFKGRNARNEILEKTQFVTLIR
jgi:gliding motility-associated-like protein